MFLLHWFLNTADSANASYAAIPSAFKVVNPSGLTSAHIQMFKQEKIKVQLKREIFSTWVLSHYTYVVVK